MLIFPSDISQITTEAGATLDTVVEVDSGATFQDANGNNPLTTLTSVGSNAVLSVPSLTLDHDLTSQGIVNVGTLSINGTYTLESGASAGVGPSLTAASVIIQAGATLGGGGTVTGSITNNGNIAPANLTVTGSYSQGSSGSLTEMFGNTLHVNSNATLAGTLNVQVNPKHPPASGASYTALTAGSIVREPHSGVHADYERQQHPGDEAISGWGCNGVLLRDIELRLLQPNCWRKSHSPSEPARFSLGSVA